MKKSSQRWLLIFSVGVSLTACQKSDGPAASVDKNGNCSYRLVKDFNDVVEDGRQYKKVLDEVGANSEEAEMAALNLALTCGSYRETHKVVTCNASAMDTNAKVNIGYKDIEPLCDSAKTYYSAKVSGKPLPAKPIAGIDELKFYFPVDETN